VELGTGGRSVRENVWAFDQVLGEVAPSVVEGTWVKNDAEVALGSKTMEELVGTPLGVAAGRWAWTAFADGLGVVPEAVVPAAIAVTIAAVTLVAANLVSAMPGYRAARTQSARALRAE
jgi:hypothetical protein